MSEVSEDEKLKNNKHMLAGSIIVGTVLFDVMEIVFYFIFIILDKYEFQINTFIINIILTSVLGILGGTYMWTRKLKRENKAFIAAFFIMSIIFIASRFAIETLSGINLGAITPYNGTIMALGNLGYLIFIDMAFLKFMPKYIKRIKDK